MNRSIFEMEPPAPLSKDILGADTAVLAGFAIDAEEKLLSSLKDVIERSPFRNMVTPGDSACRLPCRTAARSDGQRTGPTIDMTELTLRRSAPGPPCPQHFESLQ